MPVAELTMFRGCFCVILFCTFPLKAIPANDSDTIYFPPDDTKYEGTRCEASSGLRGVCLKLKDCAYTEEKFKTSDLCSFDKNDPIYCCPVDVILSTEVRFGATNDTDSNSLAGASVKEGSIPSRPVVQICDRIYADENLEEEQKELANQDTGSKSTQSYSYLASIGWTKKKAKIDWKCLGVFLSENIILTDAQCISSKTDPPNRARIIVPDKDKSFKKIMFNIESTYKHPDYKSPELYHNLALVKTDSQFPVSRLAKPACLWASADVSNSSNLLRLGYNDADMKQTTERNISLISVKDCTQGHVKTAGLPKGVTSELFCSSLKDRCQRGSGGVVLFHSSQGKTARPYIVGMASHGSYCKDSTPAVYIRLSSYLEWIEPFLTRNSVS